MTVELNANWQHAEANFEASYGVLETLQPEEHDEKNETDEI